MERKKRRLVGKFGGDRKSDQDLESGLVVFDEQERAISLVHQHANGANPKQLTHCLHNTPTHAAIKQQSICLIVFRRTF
jgi:transcriptional antiterminator